MITLIQKPFLKREKKHKKGIAQATLKSKNKYHSLEILLPFFLAHVAGVNTCSKSTCRERNTPRFSSLFAHSLALFHRQENEKKTPSAPQATFFLSILPSVFAVYVDILIHSPPCWARLDLILSNIDIQGEVKTIGWAADCSKGCLTTMQKFKKQPRFCYKCLSLLMFLDFEISRRQTWRN